MDGGPQQLLVAMLRPGSSSAAAHSLPVLKRLVVKVRKPWPQTQILVRGGCGFRLPAPHDWCEDRQVSCLLAADTLILSI